MKIAFIMDPISKIHYQDDTSFWIMRECQRRKFEIIYLEIKDIFVERGIPKADMRQVAVDMKYGFKQLTKKSNKPLSSLDVIFIRKEPPFDNDYLYLTYILSLIKNKVFIINDPDGIRTANEKLYSLHFPRFIPKTIISKDMTRIKDFLDDSKGKIVVKPLDNKGGYGIFCVDKKDKNINSILETTTYNGERFVIVQEYLKGVDKRGDKRILLLNGEILGAFSRIPPRDDFRANMSIGAKCKKTNITARDLKLCKVIAPKLRQDGLYFVGVDIIDGLIIEINVTSPAGIPEIDMLCGIKIEKDVVDFLT